MDVNQVRSGWLDAERSLNKLSHGLSSVGSELAVERQQREECMKSLMASLLEGRELVFVESQVPSGQYPPAKDYNSNLFANDRKK
eukprot:4678810-Amphidinium_carterae.1